MTRFLCVLVAVFVLAADVCAGGGVRRFLAGEVINAHAYYPEGPQLLKDGALLVAEMPRHRVVKLAHGAVEVVFEQPGCGPTSVKRLPAGGFWILCHLGHRVLRVGESFAVLASIDHTASGERISWPNDGDVDADGNLYLSSSGLFSAEAPASGRVIRIDAASHRAEVMADGIRYSNGVLLRRDSRRLVVSEHLGRRLLEFDVAGDGRLGNRRLFFDFARAPPPRIMYERSGPDGMAQFRDGSLLVAEYGHGRLLYLSTAGDLLATIDVPLSFVTNVAIADDEKAIYVLMTSDNASPGMEGVVQTFRVKYD